MDDADRGIKHIQYPLLVLWNKQGYLAQWYDVLSIWRDWAEDMRGEAIEGSSYFAEQNPEATFKDLYEFLLS